MFGLFSQPEKVRDAMVGLGSWGYVAFIAAFAILQPIGVPGMGFAVAASLIWPFPVSYILSMTGLTLSSSFGFLFSRFVARDWVSRRIPPRFKRFEGRLAERAFSTIFVLRLIFTMQPILHGLFGVSKVRFSTHLLATWAGCCVPVALLCYFGDAAVRFVSDVEDKIVHLRLPELSPFWWTVVGLAVAIKATLIWWKVSLWRRNRTARDESPSSAPAS